jgi:pimeloyl-ACP methyl ester carboxylesterase
MPQIDTPRGVLNFADHRQPDSPRFPVIFIHGAGGSRLDWPAQLRRMPEANAIVLDLPGHGKSPGPGRTTIEEYANDVIALMNTLHIPRAVLAGHSMGGAIAQKVTLTQPAAVAGLILIATGAKLSVHPRILEGILDDPEAVAELLMEWMWAEGIPDDVRQHTRQQILSMPKEVVHGDYLACNNFDCRARMPAIYTNTLIIGGTADMMTPLRYSEYLHDHLHQSKLVTIENGGHMFALEQPDRVAAAVRDWLNELASITGHF